MGLLLVSLRSQRQQFSFVSGGMENSNWNICIWFIDLGELFLHKNLVICTQKFSWWKVLKWISFVFFSKISLIRFRIFLNLLSFLFVFSLPWSQRNLSGMIDVNLYLRWSDTIANSIDEFHCSIYSISFIRLHRIDLLFNIIFRRIFCLEWINFTLIHWRVFPSSCFLQNVQLFCEKVGSSRSKGQCWSKPLLHHSLSYCLQRVSLPSKRDFSERFFFF